MSNEEAGEDALGSATESSNRMDMTVQKEDGIENIEARIESETPNETIEKPQILSSNRSVSFSSIEIREYPLCMGDNPGCLRGIPISMAWTHQSERTLSLHEYEASRGELTEISSISPSDRYKMLQKSKLYTRNEMMKTLGKVEADRERRRKTAKLQSGKNFEEYIEVLKHGVLNATVRRKAKARERELLRPYLSQMSLKMGKLGPSSSFTSCGSDSCIDDLLSDCESEILDERSQQHEVDITIPEQLKNALTGSSTTVNQSITEKRRKKRELERAAAIQSQSFQHEYNRPVQSALA